MNPNNLLPCPKCGEKPVFEEHVGVSLMVCKKNHFRGCEVISRGPGQNDEEIRCEAARRWNYDVQQFLLHSTD